MSRKMKESKDSKGGQTSIRSLIERARKTPQEVARLVGVSNERVAASVVKNLDKGRFWRTRCDEGWRREDNVFTLLVLKEEMSKTFLLVPHEVEEELRDDNRLSDFLIVAELVSAVDTRGKPVVWPIDRNSSHSSAESARSIAARLENEWGTMKWSGDSYEFVKPESDLGNPSWPSGTVNDLLEKAFRGQVIDSMDHPTIKELKGRR